MPAARNAASGAHDLARSFDILIENRTGRADPTRRGPWEKLEETAQAQCLEAIAAGEIGPEFREAALRDAASLVEGFREAMRVQSLRRRG